MSALVLELITRDCGASLPGWLFVRVNLSHSWSLDIMATSICLAMFVLLTVLRFRDRVDLCAVFCFAVAKNRRLLLSQSFLLLVRARKTCRFFVWPVCLRQFGLFLWSISALVLHNVFGYGSYWGIWGITIGFVRLVILHSTSLVLQFEFNQIRS